jgi:hypothetical protein
MCVYVIINHLRLSGYYTYHQFYHYPHTMFYTFPLIIRTRGDCCHEQHRLICVCVMKTQCVRFQVLTAVLLKIQVFGDVTVCRLVSRYRFGRMYCPYLQGRAIHEERRSLLYFIGKNWIFEYFFFDEPHSGHAVARCLRHCTTN